VSQTGNTTTSQLPQRALALRFITRAQSDVTQMRAWLPGKAVDLEAQAVAHIERIACKISGAAETFGFPEISAIAGAIELISHGSGSKTIREKLELFTRLTEQISALEVHLLHEISERMEEVTVDVPLSAHLPGFGARHK
jgi:HPt (histidine-containing phosphotransfer) domain-containing protein